MEPNKFLCAFYLFFISSCGTRSSYIPETRLLNSGDSTHSVRVQSVIHETKIDDQLIKHDSGWGGSYHYNKALAPEKIFNLGLSPGLSSLSFTFFKNLENIRLLGEPACLLPTFDLDQALELSWFGVGLGGIYSQGSSLKFFLASFFFVQNSNAKANKLYNFHLGLVFEELWAIEYSYQVQSKSYLQQERFEQISLSYKLD